MKILQEFVLDPSANFDGYADVDLDCTSCGATVLRREDMAYNDKISLHELIAAASEHKKVCPNGPTAAADAFKREGTQ